MTRDSIRQGLVEMAATDAAIAEHWPAQWAKANNPVLRNRSKARNNLRRQWRLAQEHQAFVAANPEAKCGNCAHCSTQHYKKPYCELDSDFHGYQLVELQDVCTRWEALRAKAQS